MEQKETEATEKNLSCLRLLRFESEPGLSSFFLSALNQFILHTLGQRGGNGGFVNLNGFITGSS